MFPYGDFPRKPTPHASTPIVIELMGLALLCNALWILTFVICGTVTLLHLSTADMITSFKHATFFFFFMLALRLIEDLK